jgi:hypothetical protein
MSASIEDMFHQTELYPGSKQKRRFLGLQKPSHEPKEWEEANYTLKTLPDIGEMRMYTIGAVAKSVGVSVPTIRLWIDKQFIPDAPYKLPSTMVVRGEQTSGRRLYTAPYIHALVRIMREHGLLGTRPVLWEENPQATDDILNEWKRIKRTTTGGSE